MPRGYPNIATEVNAIRFVLKGLTSIPNTGRRQGVYDWQVCQIILASYRTVCWRKKWHQMEKHPYQCILHRQATAAVEAEDEVAMGEVAVCWIQDAKYGNNIAILCTRNWMVSKKR